ncbi:MAG: NADH-quinone oxidoreductase subunit C [alpha proteobacterium MED-G10]|mgnify:CR=1 FL=1|nr:MAG: NADH-quinone oxidoreductase subunit C [alpha proteobacterium MED-G10]|tara:strand:+ start:483 stop:1106 length:624 start_codon:yes stop_codon:yes gene_type:complete
MSYPDKKFIVEVVELIKSLLNFCDYEISNSKNEITIMAKQKDIFSILMFLKDNPSISMESLIDLTAIDYPNQEKRFILAYNLLSVSKNLRIKVKTKISEDVPTQSITDIYPCANWYEREVWDLFGIRFSGHPDLRRILTDYDFEGHPLRKDFPLSGFTQVRFDDELGKVVKEPVKLDQDFRQFDSLSPWEGMSKYLPGDEKSKNSND